MKRLQPDMMRTLRASCIVIVLLLSYTLRTYAQLNVTPDVIELGDIVVGDTTNFNFSLANQSDVLLSTPQSYCNGDADPFVLHGFALPQTIKAHDSARATFAILPIQPAANILWTCFFQYRQPDGNTVEAQLSIRGAATRSAALSGPTAVDFGSVVAGDTIERIIKVVNTGNAPGWIHYINDLFESPFVYRSVPEFPYRIGRGDSLTITVAYVPTQANADTATIAIETSWSFSPHIVLLTGRARPQDTLRYSAAFLSFANATLGRSSTLPVAFSIPSRSAIIKDVTITGSECFELSAPPQLPYTIKPTAPCTVWVRCTPDRFGMLNGTLTVTTSTGKRIDIRLEANVRPTSARTVGTIVLDEERAMQGYTLFAPLNSTITYLMNNKGEIVHVWSGSFRPAQSAMLMEGGVLLRTATPGDGLPLDGPGAGGIVEKISWEGDVIWRYEHQGQDLRAHHDIELLPNGNVLLLVRERQSWDSAFAAGRIPQRITENAVWTERIVEVRPVDRRSGEIVWEWKAWDHLVQDANPARANYGDVAALRNRIDINTGPVTADWLHMNSIRYNAARDEILVSMRNMNEVIVIDRKTGDIVYRWGNAINYRGGDTADRTLYVQHDARWIGEGMSGAGNIMIFNNGRGRGDTSYSTIEEITPPLGVDGKYITTSAPFGPLTPAWSFQAPRNTHFYATIGGSATRLRNGNTLVCLDPSGSFVEITADGDEVWRYVSPVGNGTIYRQGQTPVNNAVFRATKYDGDGPELAGRTLESLGRLEDGPLSVIDVTLPGISCARTTGGRLHLKVTEQKHIRLDAYDLLGRWLGTIVDATLEPGSYIHDVPDGTFIVK